MALYKEHLTNKIEDDLAGRNQNWAAIDPFIVLATPTVAALKNGWTNQSSATYGAMRYYVDRDRFYLSGVITGVSATSDVCFTIPAALRPAYRKIYPALTMAKQFDGFIIVYPNTGNVEISSRVAVIVDISYRIGT